MRHMITHHLCVTTLRILQPEHLSGHGADVGVGDAVLVDHHTVGIPRHAVRRAEVLLTHGTVVAGQDVHWILAGRHVLRSQMDIFTSLQVFTNTCHSLVV